MMKTAHEASKDRLVICISHRLANLDLADEILVLKEGELVERGKAADLKKQNGEYARMAGRQAELEAYSAALDQKAPADENRKENQHEVR